MPQYHASQESAVVRLAKLMESQGVRYMSDQEAARADAIADRQDAARQREHESKFHWKPPPVRQGNGSTLGPHSFDVRKARREPEVQLGLSWGRSEDEDGHCEERHVADAVRICPQLDGLDLQELRDEEVTPFELADALRALRKRPPGIVRSTHVSFLFGVIRTARRERAFPKPGR